MKDWGVSMEVINRINNNVVLVHDGKNRMIVTGKGIGFKVYPGDVINERFIEQRFILQKENDDNYYINLLKEVDMELLSVSKKIVELAESELKYAFSMNLIFSLADHLSFSIERYKQNMAIDHPLEWEIKQFYPREIKVGLEAVSLLRKTIGFNVPDGESVFIAMHLVNSSGGLSDQYNVEELTEVMGKIISMMEEKLEVKIDQTTTAFSRFITHLRYYLIRQLNFEIDDSINEELLEIVKEKYPEAYDCALMIAEYLDSQYGNQSADSEKLYLTLHINRLLS